MTKVSIIQGRDPKKNVRRALDLLGGMRSIVKEGDRVLIKPNLVYPAPPPATTDPRVIGILIELSREAGAAKVFVGDSSSHSGKYVFGIGKWANEDIFTKTGIDSVAKRQQADIIDFDKSKYVTLKISEGVVLKEVAIAKPVVDVDVLINVPIMKTHNETLVTLGIKNLHGVISDEYKLRYHRNDLSQKLVDIHKVVRSHLTVVDAMETMEGFGPAMGETVEMNLIIASKDVVAADAVSSEIMGISAMEVDTTRIAHSQGVGVGDLNRIRVLGEDIEKVRRRFERPDYSIAGVFPGITVIEGGVCRPCYVRGRQLLEILKRANLLDKANISTVLIGTGFRIPDPDEIKGNVLIVGSCAIFSAKWFVQLMRDKAICMDGCPPILSTYRVSRELERKFTT